MSLDVEGLAEAGLNLHAVFALDALPDAVLDRLGDTSGFTQLVLVGHGGRRLWEAVQARWDELDPARPIDDHSARTLTRALAGHRSRLLFPVGASPVPLQALGALAGWHHTSPMRIGVNEVWGTWFAYRALALVDGGLRLTPPTGWGSPCKDCADTPCVSACPAGAVAPGGGDLTRCMPHRLADDSGCARRCHARLACPVADQHRYSDAQIDYHYGVSLETLRSWQ